MGASGDELSKITELIGGPPADTDGGGGDATGSRTAGENADDEGGRSDAGAPQREDRAAPGREEGAEEDNDAGTGGETVTVRSLAESIGVKPKELYDELKVPIGKDAKGDLQFMSLGELRDTAKKAGDLETRERTFSESSERVALEQSRTRREIRGAIELLAPHLKPEIINAVAQLQGQRNRREQGLVLAALPHWKDPQVRENEMRIMVEALSEVGAGRADLEALDDSRAVLFIWRAAMNQHRAKEAAARARQRDQQSRRPPSAAGPTPSQRGAGAGGLAARLDAIRDQGKAARNRSARDASIAALITEGQQSADRG